MSRRDDRFSTKTYYFQMLTFIPEDPSPREIPSKERLRPLDTEVRNSTEGLITINRCDLGAHAQLTGIEGGADLARRRLQSAWRNACFSIAPIRTVDPK